MWLWWLQTHEQCKPRGCSQEEARKLTTLRELEPLFSESSDGTNSVPSAGDATSAVAAVQKHLHAGAYEQSEIEDLIGQDLDSLYADHRHALKCAALLHYNQLR